MDETTYKTRRKPYFASEFLNQTAEEISVIVRTIDPILDDKSIPAEHRLTLARVSNTVRDIRGRLAQQGAQIVF